MMIGTLAVKIRAATLADLDRCLVELANIPFVQINPKTLLLNEEARRFIHRWTKRLPWLYADLQPVQEVVRGVWRRDERRFAVFVEMLNYLSRPLKSWPVWSVDFRRAAFEVEPGNLPFGLCLALVRNLRRLAICRNPECPAPYFLRKKANQKFCSEDCALPSQREFKRQWWETHGAAWRKARNWKKSHRKRGKR